MSEYQNKYQEALYRLDYCSDQLGCHCCKFRSTCIGTQNFTSLLQELVDKATPKKPILRTVYYNCRGENADHYIEYRCPVCNNGDVEKMKYCYNCGQALGEEEK